MEPDTQARDAEPRTDTDEAGRLSRLAGEVRGLIDDVRTWVDLKLQLLEMEIEERVRDAANRVAVTAVVVVMTFLTLVFMLVTLALALGAWWQNTLLGFAAVTAMLLVVTILVHVTRPGLVRSRREKKGSDRVKEVEPASEQRHLEAAASGGTDEGAKDPSDERGRPDSVRDGETGGKTGAPGGDAQ